MASTNRTPLPPWLVVLAFTGYALLAVRDPASQHVFAYQPHLKLGVATALGLLCLVKLRALTLDRRSLAVLVLAGSLTTLALLSAAWSEYPRLTLQRTGIILVPLLAFLVATYLTDPRAVLYRLSVVVVAVGTAFSAIALVLFLFGDTVTTEAGRVQTISIGALTLEQAAPGIPPYVRPSSVLGNPNRLASWLLYSVPLSIALVLLDRRRVLVGLALLLQSATMVLTWSRGGFLALGAALGTFLALRTVTSERFSKDRFAAHGRSSGRSSTQRDPTYYRAAVYAAVAVAAALALAVRILRPTVDSERFSVGFGGRMEVWTALVDAWASRPLLGVGFAASNEAVVYAVDPASSAHSSHLATLAELGLLGFGLYATLWIVGVAGGVERYRSVGGREDAILVAVALALFAGTAVHAAIETTVLRPSFRQAIWAILLGSLTHPTWADGPDS